MWNRCQSLARQTSVCLLPSRTMCLIAMEETQFYCRISRQSPFIMSVAYSRIPFPIVHTHGQVMIPSRCASLLGGSFQFQFHLTATLDSQLFLRRRLGWVPVPVSKPTLFLQIINWSSASAREMEKRRQGSPLGERRLLMKFIGAMQSIWCVRADWLYVRQTHSQYAPQCHRANL